MNKRYEEGRKPFFSNPGEKLRRQYIWAKNEKGEDFLQETEPIDVQQEIESYSDECDIKNIVRKASFDPMFLKTLQDTAGTEMDISEWPTNIHEYHKMIATAQIKAMQLEEQARTAKKLWKDHSEGNEKEVKENKQE